MTLQAPKERLSVVGRVLQEEYQAGNLTAQAMREVLGRQPRTIYNYLEGITELNSFQIWELAIRLNSFRLLNAWLLDQGHDVCFVPRLSVEDLNNSFHRAHAEVAGYDALTELVRVIEDAVEDGTIDPEERARIRRQRELTQMAVGQVAIAAEGVPV